MTKDALQFLGDQALSQRVEDMSNRAGVDAVEIVREAVRGYLAWNDEFVQRVERGIAAADRGDFASDEDVERVFGKHRPA